MDYSDFGKRLIQARQSKGWTQMDLADKSNISLRTIQRIESGKANPRAFTLKQLAEITGLDFFEILDNSGDSDLEIKHSRFAWSKIILWHFIDLFNLKTNTMKKVTILTSITIITTICLFSFNSNSTAQGISDTKRNDYIVTNSRDIIYLIPREAKNFLSNTKDTADIKVGDDLIQEFKGSIFLNNKYVGRVLMGDTVRYDNGKLELRNSYYLQNSSYRKDLFYLFPKGETISNMSLYEGTESFHFSKHILREKNFRIFIDDKFIDKVHSGDTIVFRDGVIQILR